MPFFIVLAAFVAYAYLDVRNERICRRAVDEWNANRPDDDPRVATMY